MKSNGEVNLLSLDLAAELLGAALLLVLPPGSGPAIT